MFDEKIMFNDVYGKNRESIQIEWNKLRDSIKSELEKFFGFCDVQGISCNFTTQSVSQGLNNKYNPSPMSFLERHSRYVDKILDPKHASLRASHEYPPISSLPDPDKMSGNEYAEMEKERLENQAQRVFYTLSIKFVDKLIKFYKDNDASEFAVHNSINDYLSILGDFDGDTDDKK